MLVVWASGFAADKTYSYTFVKGGVFTEAKQTKTFNNISWDFATQGSTFQFDGKLKAFRVGSKSTPANEITFTTKDFAGTIKSVSIEGKNDNNKGNAKVYVTVGGTTYNSTKQAFTTNFDRYTLTGSSSGTLQIKITCTGKSAVIIKTITVVYEEASTSLTLDENADDTDTKIENNNGKTVDVTLTRTLTAGAWNTICLPFDVTVEQMEDVLKSTVSVKEYGDENADTQTIYFNDATTMVAGKPYLIKLPEGATIPTVLEFKGVTIKNVGESDRKFGSDYKICGTFGKYTMKTDGSELFLTTQGKFAVPAPTTKVMRGFRAYFLVPTNTAGAALNLSFGEATGIDGVAADAEKNVKVYNVNGQYVGTNLEALPKGLYIVGGKKVLK